MNRQKDWEYSRKWLSHHTNKMTSPMTLSKYETQIQMHNIFF